MMEGYNNIKMEQVGFSTILCDFHNFFAIFPGVVIAFGCGYCTPIASSHWSNHFKVNDNFIGLYWGA
jgi:hypothetical protein